MDPIATFFSHPTPRRLLVGVIFLGLLYTFAHLLPVLAAFAVFQRVLAVLGAAVSSRTGWREGRSALAVAAAIAVAVGVALWLGGRSVAGWIGRVEADLPALVATVKTTPIAEKFLELAGEADWAGTGMEAAAHAVAVLREIGVLAIDIAVGFSLALIWALEREELDRAWRSVDPRSIPGTLLRWVDHVGDGLAITVQLQLVVAACNSLLTLPVLLLLGMPYVAGLLAMIFFAALVPVVGNLVSGAVLAAVAWPDHGWVGVAVFGAITFMLGKIEGFYLNPRLAARHVTLPSFVLTTSLVLFEHLFGFVGFFLSFPFLYVVGRIRQEAEEGLV
jgi:predicted PurR-regulated permease PerM